jgi:hypothetical protein
MCKIFLERAFTQVDALETPLIIRGSLVQTQQGPQKRDKKSYS